ncbi:threonine-phosphate decarboxylase CobD [Sedimentibacter sp.]|uniref:threonine-phosphate decarboxylase CobD n=1 Tax=Sedimentibacter sp. TaxID=1960295 RepID=UPI00289FBFBA|nr:threonine-phosphate decarboxylase CobD [Sedimentibacter sp.]
MEKHGADIFTAAKISGINENDIIDFSSNINPFGIPSNVERAIIDSVKYSDRYPDMSYRRLIEGVALYENVPGGYIFPSNGAAEAIFRIALGLKPSRALLTAPTFSEYETALNTVDCGIKYYNLKEDKDFNPDDDILDEINGVDIVFICNPNNPTGQITDNEFLEKFISQCKVSGITVVIDECFMDFVEDKEKFSVCHLLERYDNLIILKAFTKIYAIPGIRFGYCMSSNEKVIERLKKAGPPWNVSFPAQQAALAAVNEREYVLKSIEYIKNQRKYLIEEIKKLNITVYESYANYVLLKLNTDIDLKEEFIKKGILIRSCGNYKNLSDKYYRIAVKTEKDNKAFIKILKEIMVER